MMDRYFHARKELLEKQLRSTVSTHSSHNKKLMQASMYALQRGKRVRPLLIFAGMSLLEADEKLSLQTAVAIELLHKYSLIHDDLPCMDDDDMRNGIPSLHKAFPEWLALLTGNFFLTLPFELLAKDTLLSLEQRIELISSFSHHAGSSGLLGGQILDLLYTNTPIDETQVHLIHMQKTVSLFSCSLKAATIIANCSKEKTTALLDFATYFGLAFQIFDDISDRTQENQAVNICRILEANEAEKKAHNLLQKAKESLCIFDNKASLLFTFCNTLLKPFSASISC